MSISSVNGGADILDGQLDVEIQIGESITDPSATVTIAGVLQANVMVDNVNDKVLFNHVRGDMRLNSKGETAHSLIVDFTNEIVLIDWFYGQSTAFGTKTNTLNPNDTVSESTADIRMMNSAKTALVAATRQIPSDETPSLNVNDSDCALDFANYFRNYSNARGTTDIEQVLLVSGKGASSIAELAEGTVPYVNAFSDFNLICDLIRAEGKIPFLANVYLMQGEKNVNTSTVSGWASAVATTLYDPMVVDAKAETGQVEDPNMLLTAISMHSNSTGLGTDFNDIALEQLALQDLRPGKIRCVVNTMFSEHTPDGIHRSGKGCRYERQMFAKFAAYTDLLPLRASHAVIVASTVELYMTGGTDSNLQFDYTMHSATTAEGMRVFNSSVAAVTISSVALDNVNHRIIVTLADGGTNGPYTIDGGYFSDNNLGGGQFYPNAVPIFDTDTRKGTLSDSSSIGNQDLFNPLMPFNLTVQEP